ncbi:MAG: ATP-binding protein [Leptospira sp.]|nr:ATP-binding protein [Leptospira sp.]
MNEENKSKSAFFSKITHELRTPLHAVIGYSQILAKDPSLPEHLKGYVHSLHQNGVHLLGMINDLLDLSKIEAGKMTENREVFSLVSLYNFIFSMFGYRFLEKGITFRLNSIKSIPETNYFGDLQKIRQILINLIGNALKFTNQGEVLLDISLKESKHIDGIDLIEFSIQDTGIGIPEDQLEIIFEAFHQTDIGSAYQEGTGLGLSISRQLVQFLKGSISVKSELGKGSTFVFQLPLQIDNNSSDAQSLLNAEPIKFINSNQLIRSDFQDIDELSMVKQFLLESEEENRTEILSLIRLQDFQKLLYLLNHLPNKTEALSILEKKATDRKFKFFVDLMQTIN